MDYSKTVNLPKTGFAMKANLPQREPEFQKMWEEDRVYDALSTRDSRNGDYILHDGPPYSNGDIHTGHALNKILKDLVIRYKAMQGHRTPLIPGWDNHGLPIEQKVSDKFRKKKQTPTKLEMRKACREYAAKWVDTQRSQMKRLGLAADWDNPYLTMNPEYESAIIKVFGELAAQGYIYRGLKPIYWCTCDETALAEAEIEYDDHASPSIYVRFPLMKDPNDLFADKDRKNCYTIIWTTTPWTIPANLAVAVHPHYEYAFVDVGEDRYLLAADLVSSTMMAIDADKYCVVKTVKGSDLEGMVFKHPIYDRDSVLVHADYVTLEDGTGVVHTAPGHGREDFETGQKYGLDILCPVDERGVFTKEAGQFEGQHINKGGQAVLDALSEAGHLLASSEVVHSYPHCWRCHHPVIFRTTVQWFMALDHKDLRKKILDAVDSIKWYPKDSRNRLTAMIENSPDWCLSRQRSWGVGIPVFYCKSCNEAVMTEESIDAVYQDAVENGADSWFEKEASEILPEGFKCPACGGTEFTRESDVLDVWFDSGSSSRAVLEQRDGHSYPADMYCEGSDQHRGWFNKSLVVGLATRGRSPFKELVSHGFVLDAEGKKMAKSQGNVLAPQEVVNQSGADVLRLFVSSADYFEDVRIGKEILTRVTDAYRRIRNTFRFILGNVSDFDPAKDSVEYSQMEELDRYMLHRLEELKSKVTKSYETYEFHKVYQAVHNFCAVDLSSLYLDVLKDRLYASRRDEQIRRSAQTVLYQLASELARMMAPIIVHTADEVWRQMPGAVEPGCVHLADFPQPRPERVDEKLAENWKKLLEVRDAVLLKLEEAKQSGKIAKPLASRIKLSAPQRLYEFLKGYEEALASIFIVSQVELVDGGSGELEITVTEPLGQKCERCWLFVESVGSHDEHPTLCDRCFKVIS